MKRILSSMPTGLRIPKPVAFVAMSAALLSFFVAAGAPTPIFPLYERAWGFPTTELTLAFGVYAVALIVGLLVFGALSDHLGRRPLLIGALVAELVAMAVFLVSPSVEWLIAGRVLQGLATGAASATFGAAVVELAPESRKRLGAVMTSLATTAGLGIGALAASVVALAIPAEAATIVWIVLAVVMAAGTVLAVLTPETSTRRAGALRSLVPHVAVAAPARRLFAVTAPVVVAVFFFNAFLLGLLPVVLGPVFGVRDALASGLLNFVAFGTATATAALSTRVGAHLLRTLGALAVVLGSALLLAGLASGEVGFVWVAAVVGGAGSGAGLSGSTRGLVPQVAQHERAALFSAFFVVAYTSLSVAIIGGGLLGALVGVVPMTAGYGVVLVAVALAGAGLGLRSLVRPATAPLVAPAR